MISLAGPGNYTTRFREMKNRAATIVIFGKNFVLAVRVVGSSLAARTEL